MIEKLRPFRVEEFSRVDHGDVVLWCVRDCQGFAWVKEIADRETADAFCAALNSGAPVEPAPAGPGLFFAVAVSSHGFLQLVGKPQETRDAVLEHFGDAWAQFNSANAFFGRFGPNDTKQYGIAQVIDGVEMKQPPQFALVPILPALPSSKGGAA